MRNHRTLIEHLKHYFLGNYTNSKGPLRAMRTAAKKEGDRMVAILDDLLVPDPQTRAEVENITNVCVRIREALMIVAAQLTLSWEAAISFANAVGETEPSDRKDFDALWINADTKFPLRENTT